MYIKCAVFDGRKGIVENKKALSSVVGRGSRYIESARFSEIGRGSMYIKCAVFDGRKGIVENKKRYPL